VWGIEMKTFMNRKKIYLFGLLILVFALSIWGCITPPVDTSYLDRYQEIKPAEYARRVSAGELKRGERFFIEDTVLSVNGNRLTLMRTGIVNSFLLSQATNMEPEKLKTGARVRVYTEVFNLNNLAIHYADARISFLVYGHGRTPNIAEITRRRAPRRDTRRLDSIYYEVIPAEEYDFLAATGGLSPGQFVFVEDTVLGSGDSLTLLNCGVMNIFTLEKPANLALGKKVRIYAEITSVNTFSRYSDSGRLEEATLNVEARVAKLD
jgi:hypothetical protein